MFQETRGLHTQVVPGHITRVKIYSGCILTNSKYLGIMKEDVVLGKTRTLG